jgi:hypothetical protein
MATNLSNEIYDNMGANKEKRSNAFIEGSLYGFKIQLFNF